MSPFIKKFYHAFSGLSAAVRTELNLKIHIVISLLVVAAGIWKGLNNLEWAAILLCIGSVIGAELMNTAIETHLNLTHPEYHELAGRSKDIAAAAVLITALVSAIVGCIIFIPKFM